MQVTTPMHEHATMYATHTTAPAQPPTMEGVWGGFPTDRGLLAAAVQQRIDAAHVPLVPVHVPRAGLEEPRMRPRPYADALVWLLLKHGIQLAFVASVVMFALYGGRAPLMALGYVGTGFLLIGSMVIADRQRYEDRDPNFAIVEFIAPDPVPVAPREVRPAPLAPLVEQMQVVLPEPVSVT